ncbi:MAG: GntR family transcriptional regulator [Oscillibacter sp.]|nr:GntR family transcriptional regulator [Oscillibacter sp.]
MKFVKPLQIQAYERLKAMIIQGDFQPNVIYSETKVSQTLGVSRTPARDAIQRLAQEGYLDVLPSKGFCLHKMTERDLLETYQIRCALEGFCVVQLARDIETSAARETVEKLETLLRKQQEVLEGSHSIAEFAKYDQEFHETIVYYLQNAAISETFDNFHYQMSRQIALSLGQEGRMEATLKEHRAIVENMRAGAAGRSYEAALEHLEKPKGIIHLDSDMQEREG